MINFFQRFRCYLSIKTYEKIMTLWNTVHFIMFFNQLQKVLIFNLFMSTCYKIHSFQNTSVNTIPRANSSSINTNGRYPHKMTLQYWLPFYELVFLFLLRVYYFEKWKIWDCKSSRSHFLITPATFCKIP